MLKTVFGAVSAGIMISIGGSVFLSCDSKYVGAVLFSVALLCICYLGYYLFTGKIGYLANDFSKNNILNLCVGLTVNLIVTFLLGMLISFAFPALLDKAYIMCTAKLEQTFLVTLYQGDFLRSADVYCG